MPERHTISWLWSCSLALAAYTNDTTPVCPDPLPATTVAAVVPTPEPEPEPTVAAPASEPEPSEPVPDPRLATRRYNTLDFAVRVGEREPEGDDEDPQGFVRLEVRNSRTEGEIAIERPAEFSGCFVDAVTPEIDVIFSDEELVVLDAKYTCVFGETIRHVDTGHLVVALEYSSDAAGILYEGASTAIDNRRLAVTIDRREFHVEAGELAIYRHSVAWCDKPGLEELTGAASCARSPRKLKLLERVAIGVAEIE